MGFPAIPVLLGFLGFPKVFQHFLPVSGVLGFSKGFLAIPVLLGF
jgi:hypothetical protein